MFTTAIGVAKNSNETYISLQVLAGTSCIALSYITKKLAQRLRHDFVGCIRSKLWRYPTR